MNTIALLLDRRPAYLNGGRGALSLLRVPLGAGTVLSVWQPVIRSFKPLAVAVRPDFEFDGEYQAALSEGWPEMQVLKPGGWSNFLRGHELSDHLLLVEVRWFPGLVAAGRELREVAPSGGARYLVHQAPDKAAVQERVLLDEGQRIRDVQRLYDGVTHVAVDCVSAALIPFSAAGALRNDDLSSLAKVRARLSARGIPSRDVLSAHRAVDLGTAAGVLSVNERLLVESSRGRPPQWLGERAPGIWNGPGCGIDGRSRLYGPVILHRDVVVGANATIVGPVVLGAGASVGEGATVIETVVCPGVRIEPRTAAVRCIAAGSAVMSSPARMAGSDQSLSLAVGEDGDLLASPGGTGRRPNWYAGVKRALDAVAALAGLAVLSPLLLLVSVLIKLTSRGPVLFAHEREGLHGRVFRCWKFRTMVADAHLRQRSLYNRSAAVGPQFKIADDPRTTWLGKWLRGTNMDELPQLLNVLLGHMSLIGPRPSPFRENQICVPWRRARLSVRPGITGLWQMCRSDRAAGDFYEWIYFDLLYVRHLSPGLDLRILIATVLTLSGRWPVPLQWMIPRARTRPVEAELPCGTCGPTRWQRTAEQTTRVSPQTLTATAGHDNGELRP